MKLVVISQTGCNPCQMVKNFLKGEEVEFVEYNISTEDFVEVDGHKISAFDLGVMGTPTTILVEDGEEIGRVVGFNPPDIQILIDQL